MSKLRGVKPEKIEKRLKMFLFGPAGVGKTLAALQFPNAYIIDTEKGCDNYGDTIKKSGSIIFQSADSDEIRKEIESLLTESHDFRTLIIDPVTILYQSIQDVWTRKFERDAIETKKSKNAEMQDFGMRYWQKVKSNYKSLQRLILKLDMNVIVVAHQKDVYGQNFSKIGVSFDSMKGDDYFFDYIFQLVEKSGKRIAITKKERAEIDKTKFPEEFAWTYENFCKYYGSESIERKAQPVAMATQKQIDRIKALLEVVNVPSDAVEKWFKKADVEEWGEFTHEQLQKCVDYCEKKMNGISSTGEDTPTPTPPEQAEQPMSTMGSSNVEHKEENNGKKKRGRPKKVKVEPENAVIVAIHKIKERLAILEVPPGKAEDMVVNLRTHVLGEGTEPLTLSDYDKVYEFLGRVKAREGYEMEKDLFRSIKEEVVKKVNNG